jgi:hypothetical protein
MTAQATQATQENVRLNAENERLTKENESLRHGGTRTDEASRRISLVEIISVFATTLLMTKVILFCSDVIIENIFTIIRRRD